MNFKKIMVSTIVTAITISVWAATPQVKNVKAFQQYPWGKVYISYEVDGDVSNSTGRLPLLFVTAKDKVTGEIYGYVSSEKKFLTGDTGTTAGTHKIVWDVAGQGLTINSSNVVFTVLYCNEVYLVVDLASGVDSPSYPVSYMFDVPPGGWGEVYKTTKLVLRRIDAGTFLMGGSISTTISKPFYIGIFEVTQKQYQLLTGGRPSFWGNSVTYPVEQVSWEDVKYSFLGRLQNKTGLDFNLPTEAQWEYACRAGTTTTYSYGDTADEDYMWYFINSRYDHTYKQTNEVGTKLPNPWGLYDMHGNVYEWCRDTYADSLPGGTDPISLSWRATPKKPDPYRVLRGGCYDDASGNCSSAYRGSSDQSYSYRTYGFRLVVNTTSD